MTGQTSILDVPIVLGKNPDKSTGPSPATIQMCSGTANATTGTTPPVVLMPSPLTSVSQPSPTTMSPSAGSIMQVVANPSPGDKIHPGSFSLAGSAFDRSALMGSGIDRVEVFLDSSDSGGLLLATAKVSSMNNWQAVVKLPENQEGLHSLVIYAHSSVNGQISAVSVPVNIVD